MTRKLRNSLNALVVTAAIFATGAFAIAAVPFSGPVASAAPSTVVRHDAVRHPAGTNRRIRHQLAMPYFSFLPRG